MPRDDEYNDRWGRSIHSDYHDIDPKDLSSCPDPYERKPYKDHKYHCMCRKCDPHGW